MGGPGAWGPMGVAHGGPRGAQGHGAPWGAQGHGPQGPMGLKDPGLKDPGPHAGAKLFLLLAFTYIVIYD